MDIDKITDNLIKAKLKSELNEYKDGAKLYRNALRYTNSNFSLVLIGKDGATEIETDLNEVIRQINQFVLDKRKNALEESAISEFLNQFDKFKQYMYQMENYPEDCQE